MSNPTPLIPSLMSGPNFQDIVQRDSVRAFALIDLIKIRMVDAAMVTHLTTEVDGITPLDTLVGLEFQNPERTAKEVFDAIIKTALPNVYKGYKGGKGDKGGKGGKGGGGSPEKPKGGQGDSDDDESSHSTPTVEVPGLRRHYIDVSLLGKGMPAALCVKKEVPKDLWKICVEFVQKLEQQKSSKAAHAAYTKATAATKPSAAMAKLEADALKYADHIQSTVDAITALKAALADKQSELQQYTEAAEEIALQIDAAKPTLPDILAAKELEKSAKKAWLEVCPSGDMAEINGEVDRLSEEVQKKVYGPFTLAVEGQWPVKRRKAGKGGKGGKGGKAGSEAGFNLVFDGGAGSKFSALGQLNPTTGAFVLKKRAATLGNNNIVKDMDDTVQVSADDLLAYMASKARRATKKANGGAAGGPAGDDAMVVGNSSDEDGPVEVKQETPDPTSTAPKNQQFQGTHHFIVSSGEESSSEDDEKPEEKPDEMDVDEEAGDDEAPVDTDKSKGEKPKGKKPKDTPKGGSKGGKSKGVSKGRVPTKGRASKTPKAFRRQRLLVQESEESD